MRFRRRLFGWKVLFTVSFRARSRLVRYVVRTARHSAKFQRRNTLLKCYPAVKTWRRGLAPALGPKGQNPAGPPTRSRAWQAAILGPLSVDAIDTPHVIHCIEPPWATRTETASRLRVASRVLAFIILGNRFRVTVDFCC